MKVKVCVIGHFGGDKVCLDGQTIKTKIVTKELVNQLGKPQVNVLDTYGGKKALIKCFFKSFCAVKNSDNIVMLPACNGVKFFTPILLFWNIFFHRKLHYSVIGGWLPDLTKRNKTIRRMLQKFDFIYVETNAMKNALQEQGFKNVQVVPNCKELIPLKPEDVVYYSAEPYRLCTFSRVSEQKGIADAVLAVKMANEKMGRTVYTLDIYGQIDSGKEVWFEELKAGFPEYINYGGLVPFDKSVDTLKEYFALLFPTYYEGEGFAGTAIDAMSAGLPIIASDWKYNAEVVTEDIGFIFETHNVSALCDVLLQISENPSLINSKKVECIKKSHEYMPKTAMKKILDNF